MPETRDPRPHPIKLPRTPTKAVYQDFGVGEGNHRNTMEGASLFSFLERKAILELLLLLVHSQNSKANLST